MALYTVETHETHELLKLEACNNQLQAEQIEKVYTFYNIVDSSI